MRRTASVIAAAGRSERIAQRRLEIENCEAGTRISESQSLRLVRRYWRTFAVTPTTVYQPNGELRSKRQRLPIGSWPGHSCFAAASFTSATCGAVRVSASVTSRPRSSVSPTLSR